MSFREIGPELESTLKYLRSIGWEEIYAPEGDNEVVETSDAPSRVVAAAPPVAEETKTAPKRERSADPLAVARAEKLSELAEKTSSCTLCRLSEGRRNVVFGAGNADADLMFVGEGPGEQEDRQGLPFVGPAGELLSKIIQAIGMERSEVYIANVVKCRPPSNRNPESGEVAACMPYLERQIQLVRPRVIVALGRVAAESLLGTSSSLGRMRGQWYDVLGIPTRVTYHPAALLRQASYKRPTWEDMQIVRDRLMEGE